MKRRLGRWSDGMGRTHIASSEITPLEHEAGDHTMETGSGVSEALLTGAESAEVLGCFGDDVVVQVENDFAGRACVETDLALPWVAQI